MTAELVDFGSLSNYKREDVNFVGKVVVESLKKRGIDLKEELTKKTAKEDLDVTSTQLYTTAIASFIEKRLRPELVAAGVIKKISNFDAKGQNSVKIPLRSKLITAADLPDSGAVSYDNGTFGSTTITLAYSYAANSISHEITKFSNVDLIAEELGEIGDALARKQDSDIIAALVSATTSAAGNAISLGAGTYVAFSNLVNGLGSAKANYAFPDMVLFSPVTEARIVQLAQFSGSQSVSIGALAMPNNTDTFSPATSILRMKVVVSQQVSDKDIFLIDSKKTGYLVEASGVEVFDGRRTGYLAYEVIGALNYGVGIVQPNAVFRIVQNG